MKTVSGAQRDASFLATDVSTNLCSAHHKKNKEQEYNVLTCAASSAGPNFPSQYSQSFPPSPATNAPSTSLLLCRSRVTTTVPTAEQALSPSTPLPPDPVVSSPAQVRCEQGHG